MIPCPSEVVGWAPQVSWVLWSGILGSWDWVPYSAAGDTMNSFHALAGQQAGAQDMHGSLIGDLNQATVYTEFPGQTRPLVLFYKWVKSWAIGWAIQLPMCSS